MKNCPFQDHLLIKNEIFHAIAILEDQGDPGGISICIVAESWILFLSFSHRSLVKVKQENSEPSTWRGHWFWSNGGMNDEKRGTQKNSNNKAGDIYIYIYIHINQKCFSWWFPTLFFSIPWLGWWSQWLHVNLKSVDGIFSPFSHQKIVAVLWPCLVFFWATIIETSSAQLFKLQPDYLGTMFDMWSAGVEGEVAHNHIADGSPSYSIMVWTFVIYYCSWFHDEHLMWLNSILFCSCASVKSVGFTAVQMGRCKVRLR